MKVAVIAGGVGGARMARGFAGIIPPQDLSVIVNVGDDERFHGLYVCPDLDTVLYTLSGVVDRSQGWGVAGDETKALEVLRKLQSPGSWMKLGDADLGLHIYRSSRLAQGASLTSVMQEVSQGFGVRCALLPASDDECPTEVETAAGLLRFQEWFVRDRAGTSVKALHFDAARRAGITDRVREALTSADLVVFAPSNPYLSIRPMLEIAGMSDTLRASPALKVAVSPLIGGRAVKGPLVQLMKDLGVDSSNVGIAASYSSIADVLVIDEGDSANAADLARQGAMEVVALATLIPDATRAEALARQIVEIAQGRRAVGVAP
ncbi:MAG: 2-phospho-L-lactate transferase [Pseudomonadota bacterium]